ncbi:hypothetical protein Stube_64690 [Streptomyces tubercidicus]|uniref:Uncharacterized protein n=1 Tax=Streptomyces tubercidicus TaxID=47759 RepID=A0A640V6I5_9ACTN|nr:hypothetical protein Stube_64690 [Streptomyces tubercidicus]
MTQALVVRSRTGSTRDSPLSRQRAIGDVGDRWTVSPTARPASGQPSWTAAAHGGGAVDRPGNRFLAPEHRIQQIDGDEVGERRHRDIRQFLCGPGDIERAADPDAGVVQQGQSFLGPPALGDVDDHVPETDTPAPGVRQPEEGRRIGALLVRVRIGGAAEFVVHDGRPGPQDPSHPFLERLGLQPRQYLVHLLPEPLFQGDQPLQYVVHPDVPQLGVEDGHTDRRVRQKRFEHQLVHPGARHPPLRHGEDGPPLRARAVENGRDLHRQLHLPAVPVARRERAAPAVARTAPARHGGRPHLVAR